MISPLLDGYVIQAYLDRNGKIHFRALSLSFKPHRHHNAKGVFVNQANNLFGNKENTKYFFLPLQKEASPTL